jgi:hypothetical protein
VLLASYPRLGAVTTVHILLSGELTSASGIKASTPLHVDGSPWSAYRERLRACNDGCGFLLNGAMIDICDFVYELLSRFAPLLLLLFPQFCDPVIDQCNIRVNP